MGNIIIPEELENIVSQEEKLFILKAGREKPLSTWISLIVFWFIWTIFIWVFTFMFIGDILNQKTIILNWVEQYTKETDVTFTLSLLWAFSLIWVWIWAYWVYGVLQKWWYFIATPNKLVYYNKQELKSVAWDEFTKNLQVKWTNVILELKSWFIVNSSNGRTERFIHHMMYISSIPNAIEIWEIIRKQIDKASNITETNNIS